MPMAGWYPKSLDELKTLVSQSLAACDVSTIRRWERRTWKFIDLYSCDKMTGPLAAYAIKMYKGHRRIPASIADEIDKLELQRLEASADPRTIAAAALMDEDWPSCESESVTKIASSLFV